MRNLILLFTLFCLMGGHSFGQGGDPEVTNFLVNPGFEFGVARYTSTGSAVLSKTTTTSEIGAGNASGSWDASASGEFLRTEDYAVIAGLEGKPCLARGYYKYSGTLGDVVVRVETDAGDSLVGSDYQLFDTGGVWTYFNVAFQCPSSDSIHLEFESTVDAGELFLDSLHLGSDKREIEISQATIIGTLNWADSACSWSTTATSFASFAVDSDCIATVTGEATEPATKIPAVTFPTLPAGDYEVVVDASNINVDGTEKCSFHLTDGTTVTSSKELEGNSNSTRIFGFSGFYSYSTSGSRTFELQAKNEGAGSDACRLETSEALYNIRFIVKRFPNDVEVAIQKPETQGWHITAGQFRASDDYDITANQSSYLAMTSTDGQLEPYSGSSPVGIACSSTNEGTVGSTTCAAGDESTGIVFNAPHTGVFNVCADFYVQWDNVTNARDIVFQLVETANNSQTITQEGNSKFGTTTGSNSGDTHAAPMSICGVFNLDAGKTTIRLMYENNITAVNNFARVIADRSTSVGERDIHWTAFPLSQQFPAAVLAKEVATGATTACPDGSNICSGTWTPTITDGTNVAASTSNAGHFVRLGDIVYFSFSGTVNPTSGSSTETAFSFTLPITPSTFSGAEKLSGTIAVRAASGTSYSPGTVRAVAAGTSGSVLYNANAATDQIFTLTGSYEL